MDCSGTADSGCVSDEHLMLSVVGDHPKTKLLVIFLDNPEMEFSVGEAAEYANLERETVDEYLDTLRSWGLVSATRTGENSQRYALCTESEAAETLAKFEWLLVKHLAEKEQKGEVDESNDPIP